MNVLFFSRSAMNEASSFGNTVMNLFADWREDNLYHFFIRKQTPRNDIIKAYYNTSSRDTVKALLKGKTSGRCFTSAELDLVQESWAKEESAERSIIESTRGKNKNLVYILEESFWGTGLWKNRSFRRFVREADPDVFFAFATNSYILYPLIRYMKRYTRAKIVLLIADDMLTAYQNRGPLRRRSLTAKLKWCITTADRLYGISEMMCRRYSALFGKPVEFLCKGCDYSLPIRESRNYPLKLVYAGNVLYGRETTLEQTVLALKELNREQKRGELEIYTSTKLPFETLKRLNVPGVSRVLPAIEYEELLRVENEADILLHVESFDPEIARKVQYSFSTKITDCLQSGSAIAAIGPAGIASMEYLERIHGVAVITEPTDIQKSLEVLLSDLNELNKRKREIRVCSEVRLASAEMKRKLRNDLETMICR